ncbi:Xaa-Pro dipeptidase [Rufibacter radiotolerans]|uniref:Xaa-Pro dipeptidase n=1 Tax=Rufibacter radiotolerans TaxID=1379910 RepID=A0A0H4VLS0_9BACT|nr:YigZ family protein [Rufibacter radiotolerans]AKQ46288.1 Xaa-Pro dipeptidase [Rufibacter radiotolerans]
MEDTYRTIEAPVEGLYKEKGSKFIARAYPVRSEEEVKEILQALRKEYFDARHHCYAYLLGADKATYRANDDGEPNHSAGDPILGQIRSMGLSNVLVVVIRYFGGVKLGVGGLIHAYKTATAEALEQAQVIERHETQLLTVQFAYEQINDIMKVVKDLDVPVREQDFSLDCRLTVEVRTSLAPQLEAQFAKYGTVEKS